MQTAPTLASVAMPFQRPQVVVRTQRLIDTTDHTDAVLLGLWGTVQPDEKEGLLAVLKTDANGEHELVITGPEGEVELPASYLSMLVSELRRAGVQ